jgi:hypothetical protein
MKEMIRNLQEEYLRSFAKWEELDMNVLGEDFEDTLTRKYEEGYSAALAMVLDLLEEVK